MRIQPMRMLGCLVVCVLVNTVAAHAEDSKITASEYQHYWDWKNGRQDPRLEGLKDRVKMRKIARTLGLKAAELKAIVARVEPQVEGIDARTAASIRRWLEKTPLKDRIEDVTVDAGQGHVVAGVEWRCGDARDIDKEAVYAAWATGKGGHIVKTLAVWCRDKKDVKQFSAKIARSAFTKIRERWIDRFASSRYIRLFESPKRGPHE